MAAALQLHTTIPRLSIIFALQIFRVSKWVFVFVCRNAADNIFAYHSDRWINMQQTHYNSKTDAPNLIRSALNQTTTCHTSRQPDQIFGTLICCIPDIDRMYIIRKFHNCRCDRMKAKYRAKEKANDMKYMLKYFRRIFAM